MKIKAGFMSGSLVAAAALVSMLFFSGEEPAAESPAVSARASDPASTGKSLEDFFDCARENETVLISAHRAGPPSSLPENSLSAIRRTLDGGVAIVEVDVAATSDGVLILMHDRTLNRTTNGRGEVGETSYREIQKLRLRNKRGEVTDESVPTLRAAIEAARGRGILALDGKADWPAIVAEVERLNALGSAVFIAYNTKEALEIDRLADGVMISVPLRSVGDVTSLARGGVARGQILAWASGRNASRAFFGELDREGVEVMRPTFNGADDLNGSAATRAYTREIGLGVDIIATDRPDAARAAIGGDGAALNACWTDYRD